MDWKCTGIETDSRISSAVSDVIRCRFTWAPPTRQEAAQGYILHRTAAVATGAVARSPSSPAGFLDGAVFMHPPPAARAPTGAEFSRFHIMADSCVLMRVRALLCVWAPAFRALSGQSLQNGREPICDIDLVGDQALLKHLLCGSSFLCDMNVSHVERQCDISAQ